MGKINTSFLLAVLANVGFCFFLMFEKILFTNWIIAGWTLNIFVFLYFLSLVFAYFEIWKKGNKRYLYIGLFLNVLGVVAYMFFLFPH